MGVLKIIRHTNKDLRYLYQAINYVTHGHTEHDNIGSPNTSIYDAYNQMYCVKRYFDKTSGNPLFHFIVVYNANIAYDVNRAKSLSASIASYFADRFQIIWCVHEKRMPKKYGGVSSLFHAHFIINSVSYIDGKMFSNTYGEIYQFLDYIKKITRDISWELTFDYNNGTESEV